MVFTVNLICVYVCVFILVVIFIISFNLFMFFFLLSDKSISFLDSNMDIKEQTNVANRL